MLESFDVILSNEFFMISLNYISVSKFDFKSSPEDELKIENVNSKSFGRIQKTGDCNECCCDFFELMKSDCSFFKMSFVVASDCLIKLERIPEHRVKSYDYGVILCENADKECEFSKEYESEKKKKKRGTRK
jgi:hypothetical protein